MKPQKTLTRQQLESLPRAFQKIVQGVAMHDPDTWKYLFSLAIAQIGRLEITPQDLARTTGLGAIGMGIDSEPPSLKFYFASGEPQKIVDAVERARSAAGKPTVAINPHELEKDKPQ